VTVVVAHPDSPGLRSTVAWQRDHERLRTVLADIDGTVVEEKIYHDAGATTSQNLRRGDLLRLIREAGRQPFERDTLYRPVVRTETAFTILT
jgi:aminodeoxyfutalosine synthase